MIRYNLLKTLSGGARPRYNSHRRIVAECALIGVFFYNILRFNSPDIIALSPLIALLTITLVRSHFIKERKKEREEEYLSLDGKTILAISVSLFFVMGIISVIYYVLYSISIFSNGNGYYVILFSLFFSITYWGMKGRIGSDYSKRGNKFTPSSEYQWRWREASFSYERGIHLANNENYLSAYYNFLNAEGRFKHISSLEKRERLSEDAEKLSKASELMGKYCKSADGGDNHTAKKALENAKAIVRVVSEPYTKKKCGNCGKMMGEASSNKRGDKFICDKCKNFGGDNWDRRTRRERKIFDKEYTNRKENRRKKGEKREEKTKEKEKRRRDNDRARKNSTGPSNKKKDERKRRKKKKKKKKERKKYSKTQNNRDNKKNQRQKKKSNKKKNSRNKNKRKKKSNRNNKKKINQEGTSMSKSKALKVLGLKRPVTEDEIKEAYREKAKEVHPDTEEGNTDKFIEVNKARKTLLD